MSPKTKESEALVVQKAFEIFELADDEQILAEMQGRVLSEYVYSFRGSDGKEVTGLSKSGVDAVCREMAKRHEVIRVHAKDTKMIQDPTDPECVIAITEAQRFAVSDDGTEIALDTQVGTKRQSVKLELKNGKKIQDKFWAEKAISKASRNARRSLIPEAIAKELIKTYLSNGGVRQLGGRGKQSPPAKAPVKPPRKHPSQTPAAPAKPKGESKDSTAAAAATARQRLFAAVKKATGNKDDAHCKQIWKDLSAFESSKDAPTELVRGITSALNGVVEGLNDLVQVDSAWTICRKSDSETLYPILKKAEGEDTVGEESPEEKAELF